MASIKTGWLKGPAGTESSSKMYAIGHSKVCYVGDPEDNVTVDDEFTVNGNRFYFDYHDGQYGFNTDPKRGADTFNPFKGGDDHVRYNAATHTVQVQNDAGEWINVYYTESVPVESSINLLDSSESGGGFLVKSDSANWNSYGVYEDKKVLVLEELYNSYNGSTHGHFDSYAVTKNKVDLSSKNKILLSGVFKGLIANQLGGTKNSAEVYIAIDDGSVRVLDETFIKCEQSEVTDFREYIDISDITSTNAQITICAKGTMYGDDNNISYGICIAVFDEIRVF